MYIYLTRNIVNNRCYIGKRARNPKTSKGYLGSGKILRLAIDKYGRENFVKTILEEVATLEELSLREQYWINYYIELEGKDTLYNIAEGGTGGATTTGRIMSDEQKQKIREALQGRVMSDEWRLKISDAAKLRAPVTEETKLKLSNSLSGRKLSAEHIENLKGKKSLEHREKLSTANKGKTKSAEHIEKLRKPKTAQHKAKLAAAAAGRQTGSCWMYHPMTLEVKKIQSTDITAHIEQGWLRGRKPKGSSSSCAVSVS